MIQCINDLYDRLILIKRHISIMSKRGRFTNRTDPNIALVRHSEPDFYYACSKQQQPTGRHATSLRHFIMTTIRQLIILSS